MKKTAAWLPAVLWMGVIFFMSAAPGDISGEQSGLVVDLLLTLWRYLSGGAPLDPDTLETLSFLVRKAAHMSEYAVLALLYRRALTQNGVSRPGSKALLLAALYACTDEIHQAFVPDRGPSPVDVLIDAAGASLGLLFGRLYTRLRR